ncbi:MAG: alpha/beta fold hydrolase [Acidimicrobiales bacterium]
MPVADANGVELYYETYGQDTDPPMLLVCGLGMQLVVWDEAWFEALVRRGYYVVAFDNRDAGLSTHLVEAGIPDLMALLEGGDPNVTYLLSDMADDAAAVLDATGVESAHILGISMGGMIAQALAISYPGRVRSICSIMSTTGDPNVGQADQAAAEALLAVSGTTREDAMEGALKAFGIIGSPGFPADEDRVRRLAGLSYDRDREPTGIARQLGAILASADRTEALGHLTMPALVIHGTSDPLVNPSGGRATAAAIPGAKLVMVEGMGHDLPTQIWDMVLDEVCASAGRVDAGLLAPPASS